MNTKTGLAAVLAVVMLAGCGGSSSKSSTGPRPLTKAQYEQELGPLLNNQVDPALRASLGGQNAANPGKIAVAIGLIRTAHDRMAGITPPAAVADLHRQAVAVLSSLVASLTKVRNAELAHDTNGTRAAALVLLSQARQLVHIGEEFTARGF